jgi:hypothetical protein
MQRSASSSSRRVEKEGEGRQGRASRRQQWRVVGRLGGVTHWISEYN